MASNVEVPSVPIDLTNVSVPELRLLESQLLSVHDRREELRLSSDHSHSQVFLPLQRVKAELKRKTI